MKVLVFDFEYVSWNEVLEKSLLRCAESFGLTCHLERCGTTVSLYVQATQETLAEFADLLGSQVPLSLFLKSAAVREVQQLPASLSVWRSQNPPAVDMPFCPQCLEAFSDPASDAYANPFLSCEICGYARRVQQVPAALVLEGADGQLAQANRGQAVLDLVRDAVDRLLEREVMELDTLSGRYWVFLNHETAARTGEEPVLLFSEARSVDMMVFPHEGAFRAMASLEKPLVRLTLLPEYRERCAIVAYSIQCGLADDFILLLFSRELAAREIPGVFLTPAAPQCQEGVVRVRTDGVLLEPQGRPLVNTAGGMAFLESGERGLFPALQPALNPKHMYAQSAGFVAQVRDENFCRIERIQTDQRREEVSSASVHESVARENGCNPGDLLGVFVADFAQCIGRADDSGYETLWVAKGFGSTGWELVESIGQSESGARLLENYRSEYPGNWSALEGSGVLNYPVDSMVSLWNLCALVLESKGELAELAAQFAYTKAPRISYCADSLKDRTDFNPEWPLRSCMSYLLAGASVPSIAAGVMESYGEYLANLTLMFAQQEELDSIAIGGDLFTHHRFAEIFLHGVSSTLAVHGSRSLLIDGASSAYGKLFLA
ncbi:hypothetical protein Selin_1088 [Desulfurispirillum indicum S5]|uniref:Uncharacterized protein n=1 Tax=Desulfurispirillum indicum (strain ATCC BAA-1389 / DSM 22839 / S5) TaxID=653733 RepID=E6W3V5_DESIS|nr:hypothetical protein [Desulfurispirillum indicum]ADU65823.1 hypothetical protein Selin_1088 [Desulfurispirillum indicum S5]